MVEAVSYLQSHRPSAFVSLRLGRSDLTVCRDYLLQDSYRNSSVPARCSPDAAAQGCRSGLLWELGQQTVGFEHRNCCWRSLWYRAVRSG